MSSTAIPDIDRTHESVNAVDTESTPPAQQEHRLLAEQILATGISGNEWTLVTPSLVFGENPAHTISLIRGQQKRLEQSMLPMRFPERTGWGNEINS